VANVGCYKELMKTLPTFIAMKECGTGFVEIAQTLLSKRSL
jgi:hypothetical protein